MSEKQSRAKRGVRNPRAKLSGRDVAAIRRYAQRDDLAYGWRSTLARRYGVSTSTVRDILLGLTWD